MSSNRRLLKPFAALLFGCALSLTLAECALRLHVRKIARIADPAMLARIDHSFPPPYRGRCGEGIPDAYHGEIFRRSASLDLVFELKPGLETCFYDSYVVTNRDGLRAPREYARPKPPDTFRVLLLGDSQTFGNGVDYEHTIGFALERMLRARTPDLDVEVINAGVDAYNLYQEAAWLAERGVSYHPDLVLILFIGNDLDLPLFLYRTTVDPCAFDRLYAAEFLASLFRPRQEPVGPLPTLIPMELYVPDEYLHMFGVDGYVTGLRRVAAVSRAHGFPVVNFVDEEVANAVFPSAERRRETRTLAASLGVLEPEFDYPEGYELSEANAHLNPEGNRIVAEQMFAALEALGLLPSDAAASDKSSSARGTSTR